MTKSSAEYIKITENIPIELLEALQQANSQYSKHKNVDKYT